MTFPVLLFIEWKAGAVSLISVPDVRIWRASDPSQRPTRLITPKYRLYRAAARSPPESARASCCVCHWASAVTEGHIPLTGTDKVNTALKQLPVYCKTLLDSVCFKLDGCDWNFHQDCLFFSLKVCQNLWFSTGLMPAPNIDPEWELNL